MLYDPTCIAIDEARAETQLSTADQLFEETDDRRAYGSGGAKLGGFIAVIESRTFIRECIRRSVQSAFAQPVLTYSTAAEQDNSIFSPRPNSLSFLGWRVTRRRAPTP
jgi:hypothetical protein